MSDHTDPATPPPAPASEAASVWVRWNYSARDGQVHAFPLDDSQYGRWPQALCSHVVPPGALGSAVTSPRCSWCVLGTTASGTGRRHRRIHPPGIGARLLTRFRRHRPVPLDRNDTPVPPHPVHRKATQ